MLQAIYANHGRAFFQAQHASDLLSRAEICVRDHISWVKCLALYKVRLIHRDSFYFKRNNFVQGINCGQK